MTKAFTQYARYAASMFSAVGFSALWGCGGS
jgi:hypothetical protein